MTRSMKLARCRQNSRPDRPSSCSRRNHASPVRRNRSISSRLSVWPGNLFFRFPDSWSKKASMVMGRAPKPFHWVAPRWNECRKQSHMLSRQRETQWDLTVPKYRQTSNDDGPAFQTAFRSHTPATSQRAPSPFSPVRIRTASSTGMTKILPSPIFPVLAALAMVSTTRSTA